MGKGALDPAHAKSIFDRLSWEVERRKLYIYRPYGHPETLCPNGSLWREKYEAGEWVYWSNKPWQLDFHNAGANHQERMLMAANRPGKCIGPCDLVETENGPTYAIDVKVGDRVSSFDEATAQPSSGRVSAVLCKRSEPLLRLTVSGADGNVQSIEVAPDHLILSDEGWLTAFEIVQRKEHEQGRLRVLLEDAWNWPHTIPGFPVGYPAYHDSCDGRPLCEEDIAQAALPSRVDVQRRNHVSSQEGDLACTASDTLSTPLCRHSSLDADRRVSGQSVVWESHKIGSCVAQYLCSHGNERLLLEAACRFAPTVGAVRLREDESLSLIAPNNPVHGSICIIACDVMPGKPVIDFTISGHHNYVAAGMIHHNSWVAAFEVAMHMTGEYPDWWQGRRFDKPVHVWTGSPTNESSRDVCQKYLLGGTDDSRIGTGTIPHSRILGKLKMRQCGVSNVVDEFRVKHVSGGYSYCNLKCHPVDERALMADGTWRQMIDVMVGEKVRCADGVDRVVDQKHCYLSAPVMAIDTRSGTIRGTPNHPVFTQRGKLRMDELQVGDVLEVADCDIRALLNPRLAGPRGEVVGIRNLEDQTVVGVGVEDVHELIVEGFRVGNSYEQGWRKWQGTEPDIIWMDEEPEDSSDQRRIYTEALTRLLTSHGIMMVTFTPLMGQTQIVDHFQHGGSGVWLGTATWDDAPHLNIEERKRLADSYPRYELQARTMGVPMLGEGRIFETPEEQIVVQPFELPSHYARIIGLDFGLDHPTAIACCAWDRDRDIFYVYDVYKRGNRDTIHHAEAIIRRDGDKIPVAWPHDGTIREKGSGKELQQIYRGHGVRMLSRSARYDNDVGGSQPQWPIINEVQERCFTDRFKVFSHCREFFEEYRHYHTKDGKIVPRNDDILKATFYALMMRRFASHGRMVPKQPAARPILTTRV